MENNRRLIDAGAFIKHFERAKAIAAFIHGELGDLLRGLYDEVIEEIKKQPAVDAVEVVHSQWEITDVDHAYGDKCYHCPECGVDEWRYDKTNYCPNCGVKMDGVENAHC